MTSSIYGRLCLTYTMVILRFTVSRSMRTARSINLFWYGCYHERWWIIGGEVLYQEGIVFVHNPDLLGDSMHFTVETLKIWSMVIVCHRMSLVILRADGAWLRIGIDLENAQAAQENKRNWLGILGQAVINLSHWRVRGHGEFLKTSDMSINGNKLLCLFHLYGEGRGGEREQWDNAEGERPFHRWRRESRVRKSRRNPRVAKYGGRSHGYQRRIRRMGEIKSEGDGVLGSTNTQPGGVDLAHLRGGEKLGELTRLAM
ncbi:hypothetical protein Acr_13g0007230 [Actinidia rufa]|uniref:Uncharacterized protein n=1 Tax=Actinidia rufa TaxID=165716 RepID=A0A7J0FKU4_9ERIC|nr:hypothetical protein Acr_13g0007230 [Actinidia rufa]